MWLGHQFHTTNCGYNVSLTFIGAFQGHLSEGGNALLEAVEFLQGSGKLQE